MTTLKELSEEVGKSRQHINNLAQRLQIKGNKVGPVKTFNKSEVAKIKKWLKENGR
jgi:biotin operon repressor